MNVNQPTLQFHTAICTEVNWHSSDARSQGTCKARVNKKVRCDGHKTVTISVRKQLPYWLLFCPTTSFSFSPSGTSSSVPRICQAPTQLRAILLIMCITPDSVKRNLFKTLKTAIACNGPRMISYTSLAEGRWIRRTWCHEHFFSVEYKQKSMALSYLQQQEKLYSINTTLPTWALLLHVI